MKRFGFPLKMYSLATIFLLYAWLHVKQALIILLLEGNSSKTMKKINSNNSFDARTSAGNGKISYWPK
jgi:hypothetical protein